mgnify:FL=1
MYFTQEHEAAILDYCSSTCNKHRGLLYENWIQPAFDQMVDKIVFTYKFTTLPNIDELREDCKIWLTTILEKYDPKKGSKAFSYFSVITKNWFIHKVKQTTKRSKREVDYEDALKEVDEDKIVCYNEWENEQEDRDFWVKLWEEIDSWGTNDMKESEKKVYEAIKILLSSIDEIDIFNKKAIYLYLREITGMNTKQVVSQLNKIRKKYRLFKDDWNNGKI